MKPIKSILIGAALLFCFICEVLSAILSHFFEEISVAFGNIKERLREWGLGLQQKKVKTYDANNTTAR